MIAHRRPCLVGRGPTQRSGHAQLDHVIRPTKRCGNCVTARRLLINSAQTFHHTAVESIMGRGSRPICRVGPKTPQNKMAATVG